MKTICSILEKPDLAAVQREIEQVRDIVQTAAGALAVRIRTRAPKKSGDLISGIVPSPWEENSKYPGKIVRQVYMDADMNDTFVKMTKNGKRYYYPASQEFGFRITYRKAVTAQQAAARKTRVPGKFFMNDTVIEYSPAFAEDVAKFVDKVVAK